MLGGQWVLQSESELFEKTRLRLAWGTGPWVGVGVTIAGRGSSMPGAGTGAGTGAGSGADGGTQEGDVAMAEMIRNAMGTTGAREQVKEWLYDALETAGWTTTLERTIINGERDKQRDKENKDTTVAELVNSVAQKAFDTVPDTVREQLCSDLLNQVRVLETDTTGANDADVNMTDNAATAATPTPNSKR